MLHRPAQGSRQAETGRVERELNRRLDGGNEEEQRQADQKLYAQIDKVRRGILRLVILLRVELRPV